ncbi:hypothetical protein EVAR_87350_1 [Eumeta japonica]|uniref:Uncharacterized protein n=1 Tax=Eumeta variegata TaxID=151549 RepID=A0A4C1YY43_EUMVA|nr:hypothetical protein EVAR_87350_1 [Eumeta japonica]
MSPVPTLWPPRRPTATPTRVALNVWSLTGSETAHTRFEGKILTVALKSYGQHRGMPKAPKFSIKTRPNTKGPSTPRPLPGIWKTSALTSKDNSVVSFPPRALFQHVREEPTLEGRPGAPRKSARCTSPASPPASMTAGPTSFGDDIQTVMAVLRAVLSSEISEFAGQL